MLKVFYSIISVFLVILATGCSKKLDNSTPAYRDYSTFSKCNELQNLDSSSIAKSLIGKWKLNSTYCDFCPFKGIQLPAKQVIVTITLSSYVITENDILVATGTWELHKNGLNSFYFITNQSQIYLGGYPLFCNQQLMFFWSGSEHSDNLFDRLG